MNWPLAPPKIRKRNHKLRHCTVKPSIGRHPWDQALMNTYGGVCGSLMVIIIRPLCAQCCIAHEQEFPILVF